ncbi:MAG: alanine dehydrogenase [Gammaproteobacteria bacterium]|jgi:alanine dehydrogenase
MRIGVLREIKDNEYRVGLVPSSVHELVLHGHQVVVEQTAGEGVGCPDEAYRAAGASIAATAEAVFEQAEMLVKVKEPQAKERQHLRPGQVLFTYLHLAPDPLQTKELIQSGAVCIGYETVTSPRGGLPLLAPMSEVAGRMAIQAGAHCLEEAHGGMGILLGGVPGVEPAKVVILGAGVVGTNAAEIALGFGADVVVLDRSTEVLASLWRQFGARLKTVFSTRHAVEQHLLNADLVIGAVLIPGAASPKLVSAELIRRMKAGAVVVDVSIDQGGCFETSRPTTHASPTYVVDGVVHYCVANMPGGVPRTSTAALNNATLPHVLTLANKGYRAAMLDDPHLRAGLNVYQSEVTCKAVADALGYPYRDPLEVLQR